MIGLITGYPSNTLEYPVEFANLEFALNGQNQKDFITKKSILQKINLSMLKLMPLLCLSALFSLSAISCAQKTQADDVKGVPAPETGTMNNAEASFGNETTWELVWSDEFDGSGIDTNNWNYQVERAGRFNGEWQRYTNSTENAYVEDGCMVIKAIHTGTAHGMDQYTSARMNTANKHTWQYGKISARIKLPRGKGMWPAFWMLGANINENGGDTPWPQCGEVDILEFYGSRHENVVEANMHYFGKHGHRNMGAVPYTLGKGVFPDDFHVFTLEWDENQLKWFVDNHQYASASITADEFSEFHKPFFILFNIAIGGGPAGPADVTTPFPQHMYIDWVRVYQKSNGNN